MKNENHEISTTKLPLATELGKMVTYVNGLLPIKSQDPFFMWSWEIIWQTKTIMCPLPWYPWHPNLEGWWHNLRSYKPSSPFDHVVLHGHVTKTCYISTTRVPMVSKLGRMITYLPWWTPTYNVAWPLDHVFKLDHLTKCNRYISSTKVTMATKICRMMTYPGNVVLLDYVTN